MLASSAVRSGRTAAACCCCSLHTTSTAAAAGTYSHTINLPRSSYPRHLNARAQQQLDERLLARCQQMYDWQLNDPARQHLPRFTLLDGPPYANGPAHLGHALNRVLKDFVVRHRATTGHRVTHRPGWDCHGLPIELKALQNNEHLLNADASDVPSIVATRAAARQVALQSMQTQMDAFKRWGTICDWNQPYYTDSNSYQARQLRLFGRLYESGLLYRARRPVFWSPSTRTALAEAELEYNAAHQSTAALCRLLCTGLDVSALEPVVQTRLGTERGQTLNIWALVWTTTPWTLPLNDAVCFAPQLDYVLVARHTDPSKVYDVYVIAESAWRERRQQLFGEQQAHEWHQLGSPVSGARLFANNQGRYVDLMWNSTTKPFWPGEHVKADVGTGLVHTAYAHGFDDHDVGLHVAVKNGEADLVECFVDERGCYTRHMGPELHQCAVTDPSTNQKVLNVLGKHIVHSYAYTHSYPYDWRTKQPVIIRSSAQWFMDVSAVRPRAIEYVTQLHTRVSSESSQLEAMVGRRPDWCISRQRVWGVPLPLLYRGDTPVCSQELCNHYAQQVEKQGADWWYTADVDELAPKELLTAAGVTEDSDKLRRETDVMDVWLDSGCAWLCATDTDTTDVEQPDCDLVLEGIDQFRGWFQSLLWTAAAAGRQRPPFASLLAHGFVVDQTGSKMSKSLGNVIDPVQVIEGTPVVKKSKKKQKKSSESQPAAMELPALGVDGLRYWVAGFAGAANTHAVLCGPDLLGQVRRELNQFALGVLNGFPADAVDKFLSGSDRHRHLGIGSYIDRHMLALLSAHLQHVDRAYETHNYTAVLNTSVKFLLGDFGSRYVAAVKDRLYCDAADSELRRQSLIVCDAVCGSVVQQLSPVLPHLASEFWQHRLGDDSQDALQRDWPAVQYDDEQAVSTLAAVAPLVKEFLSAHGNSAERSAVHIVCHDAGLYAHVQRLASPSQSINDLVNLFRCASVTVELGNETSAGGDSPATVSVTSTNNTKCERCRRYLVTGQDDPALCERCTHVLNNSTETRAVA